MKTLVYGAIAVLASEFLGSRVASAIGVESPTMGLLVRAGTGGAAAWAVHKVW